MTQSIIPWLISIIYSGLESFDDPFIPRGIHVVIPLQLASVGHSRPFRVFRGVWFRRPSSPKQLHNNRYNQTYNQSIKFENMSNIHSPASLTARLRLRPQQTNKVLRTRCAASSCVLTRGDCFHYGQATRRVKEEGGPPS